MKTPILLFSMLISLVFYVRSLPTLLPDFIIKENEYTNLDEALEEPEK